jgi:uncharacterized repeat protein (TIGR01451 family)
VLLLLVPSVFVPPAAAQTTLIVNVASSGTTSNGCDVTDCSLLDAINQSNSTTGTVETITFNIPNSGVQTILTNAGFSITQSVILDAMTQPGYSSTPLIEIRPSTMGLSYGIRVLNQSVLGYDPDLTVTIRGLSIGGFTSGLGIQLANGQNHLIEHNHIGVDASGTVGVGNDTGISLRARNSTIRNNVISGNGGAGIILSSNLDRLSIGNSIVGNYIGTNVSGTAVIANGHGIQIIEGASDNTVGGVTAADRNLISGNADFGITVRGSDESPSLNSINNIIQGNYIGTDVTGTLDLGNGGEGILLDRADSTTVGGTSDTTPGGSCTGACNLISGNNTYGIMITSAGVNVSENNIIQGNYIGTDVTGTLDLGNSGGIQVRGQLNTIGGTTPQARNLISGNNGDGIVISGLVSFDNLIVGNYIGTDATGISPLRNELMGILLGSAAYANRIGDSTDEGANWIGYNGRGGIAINPQLESGFVAEQNLISGNSIFYNEGLGIDLLDASLEGVNPNDPGDGDSGPNGFQNFPLIDSVLISDTETVVSGTLDSTANRDFDIELFLSTDCDASGYGEGEFFLGALSVTTDANGFAAFEAIFDPPLPADGYLTATAIDADSIPTSTTVLNTSEFSPCVRPEADLSVSMSDAPDPAQVDSFLTYQIMISNLGPEAASSVELVDTLPANVALIDARTAQGSCTPGAGTVNCAISTLASGGSATVTVLVRPIDPAQGTTISNSAVVSALQADPVPGNNSVSVTTKVVSATVGPQRNLFTSATPTLTWARVSWATGYRVEVDNNSTFSSPEFVDNMLTADTFEVTTTPLADGLWYWRVSARRADGTWGTPSQPDSFVIDVP